MHILLINTNPVVSRLLVLCTRDDSVVLDEVSIVEDVQADAYDIIFVDEASYGRDVADLLVKLKRAKKIFISYRSDAMRGFDETIKKPFLPSQITDIINNIEIKELETHIEERGDSSTPTVLDSGEIEKIKALLDMDDEIAVPDEVLSEEEIEARKVELIKEQLIKDGLEIVEEDDIVAELSLDLDGTLTKQSEIKEKKTKKSKKKKKSKFKKSKNKKIKFTEENMECIEDAVEIAMATMTKKQMKKLLKGKEIEISVKLEDKH